MCVCRDVCLSVREEDLEKSLQVIFMKPCKIVDYCYKKEPLNLGDDPTESG